ncbi:MAG TPA: outer membrane lipoprotein carrier protein LolA [Nitrospiraceae bacterium]|jgi:outer membrane lipoprotein carrier protein|nr:outer membrane lipoprotein carrier protein LolA [Nitrospiraceae bacterium]
MKPARGSLGHRFPVDGRGDPRSAKPRLRTRVLLWAAVVCVCFTTGIASVAAEEGKDEKEQKQVLEVVKKLQARYEQTKDLLADFQQTTRIEGFATPLNSSGRMYIKKPGLLRWDYREPDVEEIYVNRNDVMMYVPEHKQVLVGKLTQMAASQAPLQLLQGVAKLDEEFDIEPSRGGERGEGGLPLVMLTPKAADADPTRTLTKIVVEVQPKTHYIKSVTIHEVSGNISTFRFTNLKPNSGLQTSVFEFKVPPGVEVVKAPSLSPP